MNDIMEGRKANSRFQMELAVRVCSTINKKLKDSLVTHASELTICVFAFPLLCFPWC